MMGWDPEEITQAIEHLTQADPVLASVIDAVGPFRLKLETNRFQSLVWSILSQQISGKAARSIRKRVVALIAKQQVTADRLAALSIDDLRSAGVSPQKARYIHDLASKVSDGTVRLSRTGRMTDEDVITELIQVTGIGVWTAQMFLMFSLGRINVFPHGDLGIRMGLKNLHGLSELPDPKKTLELGACWQPYATVGSWYCWRSLELPQFQSTKS